MEWFEKFDYYLKLFKYELQQKKQHATSPRSEISHKAKNQANMLNIPHENTQKRNNKQNLRKINLSFRLNVYQNK